MEKRTDKIIETVNHIRELDGKTMSKLLKTKFMNILEKELKERILSLKTMKEDLETLRIEYLNEINSHLKLNDTGHNVIDRENYKIGHTISSIINSKNKLKKEEEEKFYKEKIQSFQPEM
jgi:uncharacterized protein YnzC (UPF0291/DUF896 family)